MVRPWDTWLLPCTLLLGYPLPMTQLASSTLNHQVPGLRKPWQPFGGTSKGHPPSREREGRTRPGCSRDSNPPLGSQTSLKKLTWERASVGLRVPYLGSNHPVSDPMGQGQGPSNEPLTLHLPSGRLDQTPPHTLKEDRGVDSGSPGHWCFQLSPCGYLSHSSTTPSGHRLHSFLRRGVRR